jgi:serine protease Do
MTEAGRETVTMVPAIVYLSGRRRGTTTWPDGDYLRIGTLPDAEIGLARVAGEVPAEQYGILRRVGESYELDVATGKEIRVNGDPVDRRVLVAGDMLEVGPGGPRLRFRMYPAGATGKPLRDAVRDVLDAARITAHGRWGRWAGVTRGLPRQLLTQTARPVRAALVGGTLVAIALLGWVGYRGVVLERELAQERGRVSGLAELLHRQADNPTTEQQLAQVVGELQSTLSETARRVQALEGQSAATRLVIAAATRSTVFVQGAWGFVDPRTGAPLRLLLGSDGNPVFGPGGEPLVTTDEQAPVLEALFTGTGIIVSGDGLLLTNRHIARPWEIDDAARRVAAQGWVPVMRRLIAYVPGLADSLPLRLAAVSDSADLAVFRCVAPSQRLTPLALADGSPQPGEEVIVLGYPLGMRALMARTDARFLNELRAAGNVDFWSLGARLARTGQISPLASRGIVSQVSREAIVYDAETTSGGSGGPVLSLRGEVWGVTSAILPEFGGSNLGVPASRARELLARVAAGGQ